MHMKIIHFVSNLANGLNVCLYNVYSIKKYVLSEYVIVYLCVYVHILASIRAELCASA